jgi:hypothetical protein
MFNSIVLVGQALVVNILHTFPLPQPEKHGLTTLAPEMHQRATELEQINSMSQGKLNPSYLNSMPTASQVLVERT